MTVKDKTTLLVKGLERICADIAAIASLLEEAGSPDETAAAIVPETTGKAATKAAPKTGKAGKATAKTAAAPEAETADEAPAKTEPVPEPETPAEPESVPKKVYTYEEARAILAEKARTGFRAEVKAILTRHGVNQLSEVKDPGTLAAIVAEAEAISIG